MALHDLTLRMHHETPQAILVSDDGIEKNAVWLATARTNLEQGFMALNRAVFQPQRVKLPEDSGAA